MARITYLRVQGYRSIGERIELAFPENQPLVLVGENNAGKSNIVRALNLVLGPFWPGSHDPEDHEFFERDRDRRIDIEVEFDSTDLYGGEYSRIRWVHDSRMLEPVHYRGERPSGQEGYIRNEHRDSCICVVVEADRNLQYHLGYSSKWTFLSRLMHRFHRALLTHGQIRDDLEQHFRSIKEKFHEVQEFAAFVEDLRTQFGHLVASMPHRLEVDFEAYNPVNFFHALRLQAAEGDDPRSLEEMGTGEQQVLALSFAHAYAKAFHGGIVLVVEEPEAHLHPLAQSWLARRLRAQCDDGLQLVVTTHSPSFLDIERLEGIALVHKKDGQTRVTQLSRDRLIQHCIGRGAPKERVTRNTILPFYAANATSDLLSGFFARAVVLVEGPTEALALPRLLAKRALEVEKEGIAIVGTGGKGNLAKWCRLYEAYGIPSYLVFDNDPKDDDDGRKRADALRAVGVRKEDIPSLVDSDDWVVEDRYTIFGTEFETSLRAGFAQYAALEAQAVETGIDSKPFVARWVVERLKASSGDTGWLCVDKMVAALRTRLAEGPRDERLGA